jgi:acyl-CoA synthetase (AMP-forming)/AMP-acid ligase II
VDLNDGVTDVPLGETGELIIKGPQVMKGYWNQSEATAQTLTDGWLHTGDIATMDDEGYFYIVDRKKDMIISGGYNVYPRDIEEVIVQHPDVNEAAVFGVPDEKWGEVPFAAVTTVSSATATEQDLKDWVNSRVGAKFQRISRVKIIKDFPRNVAGKTLKRDLRERFG